MILEGGEEQSTRQPYHNRVVHIQLNDNDCHEKIGFTREASSNPHSMGKMERSHEIHSLPVW